MSLLVITAADVSRIASSIDHSRLENLMAFVFHTISSGRGFDAPLRESIIMDQHTTLFMPARVQGLGTSIKVVSIPRDPANQGGLPASTLVLDEDTGGVRAIVNVRQLTALRTAAGMHFCSPRKRSKLNMHYGQVLYLLHVCFCLPQNRPRFLLSGQESKSRRMSISIFVPIHLLKPAR